METENVRKSLKIISLIMILINLCGIVYQLLTHASAIAILIKIGYVVLYLLLVLLLVKKSKYASVLGYMLATMAIILSLLYFDFLTIVISLILVFYCSRLNNFIKFDNTNAKYKKVTKVIGNKKTNNKNKY
ncbi:MAG: hypothetical protein RSG48_04730 [Clostridia bacterium]